MIENNQKDKYIQFIITYAKILGWVPVILMILFSIIFILVYSHIEVYIPRYSKLLLSLGLLATSIKIMLSIFVNLGGSRFFKTTIGLKNIGVIDRNPITSVVYECCDAIIFLLSMMPIVLAIFSAWIIEYNLIALTFIGYIIKWIFCPIIFLIGLIAMRQSLLAIKKRNKAITIFYDSINNGIDRITAIKLANMVDEKYPYLESLEDYIEKRL